MDWDEVLSDGLVSEIQNLDYKKDVYYININTYFIGKIIDKRHFQPRFFEINSVEIDSFSTFHNLFLVKSKNISRLKSVLHHYSYNSAADLLRKNIFYAE